MPRLIKQHSSCGRYIGTTCLNRNPTLYHSIEEYLALYCKDPIQVVIHGCSTGQEAYTLACNLDALTENYQILALDPCQEFLDKAEFHVNVEYLKSSIRQYRTDEQQHVVVMCNMMLYIPEDEHADIIQQVAGYNSHLLAVTDVKEDVLLAAGYVKYMPHAEEIKSSWEHVPPTTKTQHILWEKVARGESLTYG